MFPLYKIDLVLRRIRKMFYVRWNRWVFKLNSVTYGNNLCVYNRFYLLKQLSAKIEVGDNVIFTSGDAFNPLSRNIRGCIFADDNAVLKIGHDTGISSSCIWVKSKIIIGNHVKIGGDCIIMDTDAHNLDYIIRRGYVRNNKGRSMDTITAEAKPIIIEDDVLIGTRCVLLKGVTIGARSIIGSGSVVTKSIPSDCIAAGNPCRIIRQINSNNNKNL